MSSTTTCPECERTAEHCHGTLVRHENGTVECTELSCRVLELDRHDLVVECTEVRRTCGCA
ncbi:hypothetical protein [Pseudonocardia nigra]|uniref:hypothetical protein n=1 Tax=Pseudonocardia nigra TaxID=1921578 RepID=UPI001C5F49CC|nr:hypothetical protein [Pseudonocardia nigra]